MITQTRTNKRTLTTARKRVHTTFYEIKLRFGIRCLSVSGILILGDMHFSGALNGLPNPIMHRSRPMFIDVRGLPNTMGHVLNSQKRQS